jgi:hypothetical protein
MSIYFWYQLLVSQTGLWLCIKRITLIKIQNNKEKHVVRQQAVSAQAWVHSLVSQSGVYGFCVLVGQICLSTSAICCQ